jgi:hypothetical protein
MAAVLLLLAAFAFYLLQDPNASLPFIPPTPTSSPTMSPVPTATPFTATPTRRTSYTPFAGSLTPQLGTPYLPPDLTATQSGPAITPSPSRSGTPSGSATATLPNPRPTATNTAPTSGTPPATTPTSTKSPTVTATLESGVIGITGRIIQDGTPVANVVLSFADDAAARQSTTDAGGHYSFITLAPGTDFTLIFDQGNNPGLSPPTEIASLIHLEGTLPQGVNPIDFPDIEISINLSGILFEPQSPIDGASYSASNISGSNQLMFIWTLYSLGGSYHVELGQIGTNEPIWTSPLVAASSYMWDGTLTDGSHITDGTYWWRVSVTKSLGNYVEVIYSQRFDLLFTP